jgi:hypothetical protein
MIKLLTGKALEAAIGGYSKKVATFRDSLHVLAASAINHVNQHGDVKYLEAVYNMTPANYQPSLRGYMAAFGRVKFDKDAKTFVVVKNKKGDTEGALAVSPADWQRARNEGDKPEKTAEQARKALIKRLESLKEIESLDKRAIAILTSTIKSIEALANPVAAMPVMPKPELIQQEVVKPAAPSRRRAARKDVAEVVEAA